VKQGAVGDRVHARLGALLTERTKANDQFFAPRTERLARLCHRMAERFARGGRLVAFAASPAARSDARHVAVEFVHPVIVGKRALPAIALTGDGGELTDQVGLLARSEDIAIAFGTGEDGGAAAGALEIARSRGCLTLAFSSAGAEWEFEPPASDRYIRQELVETLYHVLWELVHVFFEHRGLLAGRDARPTHDVGASSFLYPFLAEREHDLEQVIADVARSALIKSEEISALRAQTLTDNAAALSAAAADLRAGLRGGGTLLALGNGGSATDAMDLVADFRQPGPGERPWPAVDLTEDPAILTAIANDIGTEAMFSRQVIAYGRPGDVVLALSTSGSSANVIEALAQARRQDLRTIAFVGYDGGRIRAEGLADHVVVSRSEHIPRIQEAQASAYHALRVLIEDVPA
jgi:D-sedoheptulose 7-phosphate isomerase